MSDADPSPAPWVSSVWSVPPPAVEDRGSFAVYHGPPLPAPSPSWTAFADELPPLAPPAVLVFCWSGSAARGWLVAAVESRFARDRGRAAGWTHWAPLPWSLPEEKEATP